MTSIVLGKVIAAYTKSKQLKKEVEVWEKREGDEIEFLNLRFKRRKVVGLGKGRRRQDFHKLHVLGMNSDLWHRVYGVQSEIWKECEGFKLLVILTCLREAGMISLIS